jgi:cyclopropane-fatty-acyl-phospholipid synthase
VAISGGEVAGGEVTTQRRDGGQGALAAQIMVPPAPRAPVRAMLAQAIAARGAKRLPFRIAVVGDGAGEGADDGADEGAGEGAGEGHCVPGPVIRLRRPSEFYRRLGAHGLIGFGESYQVGDWDTDDLTGLLTVFATGVDAFVPLRLQRFRGHSAARRPPRVERQTVVGARRNARHHYALPDALFRAFLDETMCYSSAIFPVGGDGQVIATADILAQAQRTKIDRLLDLAGVGSGTRLLEIGTGWGELPVRAAQRGALVHTVTNMTEHREYARDRAIRAGMTDRVRIDVRDYRELTAADGQYDAIVSVEMIEVVGRGYWPEYFRLLDGLLAPDGRIGLQCMSMRHDRMMRTSSTHTWINKYIFPGGLIPSVEAIEQTLAQHTGLRIRDRYSFGEHYRATLALWRVAFAQSWPSVAELGFDEAFRRTWDLYLAFSEAGFAAGYLDVHQFLISR